MSFLLETKAQGLSDMLHRVIGNTFIVEYGIIKEVLAEGVVTVEMSVADNTDNIIITNCILASLSSSSVTFRLEPNVNDKVLLLFPRKYNNDMFNVDNSETIISKVGTGYTQLCGIAILLNQYQEKCHKNTINFTNGKLEMNLAYNKDEDKNMFTLNTSEDGAIEIKNDVTSINVDAQGNYEIDNGKSKISVDNNGNVTIDAMSGKISIKNSATDLKSIIEGMLNTLNTSLSINPASYTVVPGQFASQIALLGQLLI